MSHIVEMVMATAGQTRGLVRFDRRHDRRIRAVYCAFFKTAGALVTVKTFAIVITAIQLDLARLRGLFEVIDVYMAQPPQLRRYRAVHRIVRVAGVTGFFCRYSVV